MPLDERLAAQTSRRTVVKTGAKLAYAAPLVGLSLRVTRRDAGAQTNCPGPVTASCPCGEDEFLAKYDIPQDTCYTEGQIIPVGEFTITVTAVNDDPCAEITGICVTGPYDYFVVKYGTTIQPIHGTGCIDGLPQGVSFIAFCDDGGVGEETG